VWGRGVRNSPPRCTSVDRAQVRPTRRLDGRIQLGAQVIHVVLRGLLRIAEAAEEPVGRIRSGLLVRVRKRRLRSLQVRTEPVDVVQPGGRLHRLGVLCDQLDRVRVVLEVLHQAKHRRDLRRVGGGLHDAVELGGEAGGVEDDRGGVAPLHKNDQHSDEEHGDHEKQDDGQGEQRARNELVDDVHRSLSEVRSRTSINGLRGDASVNIIAFM
jgi:hypothetical protein